MSSTAPAAIASASAVFCTQQPVAPASIIIRASSALLCILACGRQRMPCLRANSAMRARLRFIASRSITSAGVSMAATSEAGGVVGSILLQVLRVGPADEGEALRGPEQAVDRRIGQLPRARRIHFLPGRDAIERIQHPAMRDHHDLYAGMPCRE